MHMRLQALFKVLALRANFHVEKTKQQNQRRNDGHQRAEDHGRQSALPKKDGAAHQQWANERAHAPEDIEQVHPRNAVLFKELTNQHIAAQICQSLAQTGDKSQRESERQPAAVTHTDDAK